MRYIIYDAETRSTLNLRQVGSYIYLNHPSADLWCVSYCTVIDGARGPISTWKPGEPVPGEVLEAYADPEAPIVSFNDAFERQLEQNILGPRHGWPVWPIERRPLDLLDQPPHGRLTFRRVQWREILDILLAEQEQACRRGVARYPAHGERADQAADRPAMGAPHRPRHHAVVRYEDP
jgi:hypothetical protein